MKIFIVFAVIVIASVVNATTKEEQDKLVKEHIKKCREAHAISDEEFAQAQAPKKLNDSENVRCFVNCFMEESGILKDGKLQEKTALEKFSIRFGAEEGKKALKACGSASGAEKCETAWKLHNCLHEIGTYEK